MTLICADPERVRDVARAIRDAADGVRDRAARVSGGASAAVPGGWSGAAVEALVTDIQRHAAGALDGAERLASIAARCERYAAALDAYLGETVGTQALAVPARSVPNDAPRGLEPTGWKTRYGDKIALMQPGFVPLDRVNWLDDRFVSDFMGSKHNGHSGRDYFEFCGHLPPVLAAVQGGSCGDDFPADSIERRVYDAFFKSDTVRIQRNRDGTFEVTDGRHRFYACVQMGIPIPVVFVESRY